MSLKVSRSTIFFDFVCNWWDLSWLLFLIHILIQDLTIEFWQIIWTHLANLWLVFFELRLTLTFIKNMYECLKYEFQIVFKINHINFKQNQTFWISITFERFSINPPMWSPYGHSFPYTMHKSNFLNIFEQTPTLEFIKF